jgi:hypothetical protein
VDTCSPSDSVYRRVVDTLATLGIPGSSRMSRVVLLRKRQLVGQRFRCEGGQAVWLIDKNTIDFFDGDGNLLTTVTLGEAGDQKAA